MASGRWFRMYDELLDDPKVQILPPDTFKAWVNLLCLASRNDGQLPDLSAIAFALRFDEKRAKKLVDDLVQRQLIDVTQNGYEPHAWRDRQYQSDVSTDRVKRYRERQRERGGNVSKSVSGNVSNLRSETPPEAETETDTENKSAARAPGRLEFDDREKRMSDAARPMPVASSTDFSPMNTMISNGFSLELDILPAIEAAKKAGSRLKAWRSLIGWVEKQRADRDRAGATKPGASTTPQPVAVLDTSPKALRSLAKIYANSSYFPRDQMAEPGTPGSPVTAEMVAEARADMAEQARKRIEAADADEARERSAWPIN